MDTILVVDDHPINRQLLDAELQYRGFNVLEAEGGEEALEMLERETFSLILLDIEMPTVDGLAVLKRVRERWSLAEMPVIMTTARVEREDVVHALNLGANDYVTKPVDLSVLLARIRTQLALKHASDELRVAQQKILQLSASSAEAMRDVDGWSRTTAAEIAELVGSSVQVIIGKESVDELSVLDTNPLRNAGERGDVTNEGLRIPIEAAGGRRFGAIVIGRAGLSRQERVLVETFATQLGAALEMRDLRWELTSAKQRFYDQRRELIDRGTVLLHVCTKCGRCYEHTLPMCPIDGWQLEGSQLLPLHVNSRYRLERRIAVGSTARLFLATDERLGRDVAVKIIKSEYFNDNEMRARFEQEARAAARVDHPHVSTVFDSGELDDGSLFFVMEMLHGCDLAQMIRKHGRGSPQQVARLLRQIGSALAAVHKAGFIHRDIKPNNIFLVAEENGFRAKLLDFGIAKPIDGDITLTRRGSFIGTPAYMAPEQIEKHEQVDTRTDLYLFAAVAYEALAGRRVTSATDVTKVFAEILHTMPPPVSALLPTATPELDTYFAAALAKRKEERPESVGEWAESVAGLLDGMEGEGWPG
ncbi:MAG TPA: response regulator [Thermoanaerobaculia bacterium]|nr:response regulator [Thermoanaerobaculia bacterium]